LTWRGVTLTLDAKERGGLKSAAIRISEDLVRVLVSDATIVIESRCDPMDGSISM